jgi:4a-hydroxytetrahydrobiopterin dehydratase
MSRPKPLSSSELAAALPSIPAWAVVDGKLRRVFRFPDFSAAFGFMARAALAAEKRGHHPDWSNAYGRVEVDLVTHDAGGITSLDLDLARELDRLAPP